MATNSRSKRRAIDRASTASAPRLSVIISTSRLRSNRRASSIAPSERLRRAGAGDRGQVAGDETHREEGEQRHPVVGSAIVNVPTGGRKKKLKPSIAATEVATATRSRDVAATRRTTSRYVGRTVVAFVTCGDGRGPA